MTTVAAHHPLAVLRRRLTLWYAATLSVIVLLLGSGLYVVIHHQLARQMDDSLRSAAKELVRAARIREMEAASAHGDVVDAVDELQIPDRLLYLLDSVGTPLKPNSASVAIRAIARRAAAGEVVRTEVELANGHGLSVHAERFLLASGATFVAVATADQIELADRYAALIAAFGGAAAAAIILLTIGGYVLVRESTAPAERSMAYTRRFMADAAHELRTPIAVLRTRADAALQLSRDPERDEKTLQGMSREAERLGRVVDELLLLARADAGERQVVRARVFLDDVVCDAVVSVRTLAVARGVQLDVAEYEETAVVGDVSLVRELVVILLDNAVKFTPSAGSVTVRVRPLPVPTLVIADSGGGIPQEQLPHVFERFYRGDTSRSREGGAGLGLSIAHWIATEHGADISLTSIEGSGTTATVTFPATPPAATVL